MNGWEKLQPITFFWNRILSRQEILARIVGEKEALTGIDSTYLASVIDKKSKQKHLQSLYT